MWILKFTPRAKKDAKKLAQSNLKENTIKLLEILKVNPLQKPPSFEKLVGDLDGKFSRRINIKHRLIYELIPEKKIVKILSMWTHYE